MSINTRQGKDRRAAVVEFVTSYWRDHGYAPSVREVAGGVGFHTASGAAYQIRILIAEGVLVRAPGVSRTLRVVQR
jgi:repressor LexA